MSRRQIRSEVLRTALQRMNHVVRSGPQTAATVPQIPGQDGGYNEGFMIGSLTASHLL